jgi:hypothetical protein
MFVEKSVVGGDMSQEYYIKSEQNDTGLGIVPGMIVMSNKSEPKASWDMNSKADMIKMCNQVKLLMGLEEV